MKKITPLKTEAARNPEAVRAALGRSDIKTTLGLYAHMFDYGAAKLAESMERRRDAYRNESVAR